MIGFGIYIVQRFSRVGPRGRGREWATLGVHPLSWLLSNNRLEKVPVVSVPPTSSNRLLLSNQDKGCTPSVAHSLPLPLGPALLNLSIIYMYVDIWCIKVCRRDFVKSLLAIFYRPVEEKCTIYISFVASILDLSLLIWFHMEYCEVVEE